MRDVEKEFADLENRKYAYEFDYIVHSYLIKRMRKYFDSEHKALEIGAYEGDMTERLSQEFAAIEVLEPSKKLGEKLASRFGDTIIVHQDFVETFQPQESYKNIILVHTLEHLNDPVFALEKISGWLSDGGRLYVAVPNANALSRQIAVQMGIIEGNAAVTPGEHQHGHRRTYSLDTLLVDIRQAGLTPIDFGGVIVKPLANFQLDEALRQGIITMEFLQGCDLLSLILPELSSTIFAVCEVNA